MLIQRDGHVDLMEMMQTEVEDINASKFIFIDDAYYDIQDFSNDTHSLIITKFVKINNNYIEEDLSRLDDKGLISLLHHKYFKDKKIKLLQNEPTSAYDENISRKISWFVIYKKDKGVFLSKLPAKDLKDTYTTHIWEYQKNIHYYFIAIEAGDSVMVSIRKMSVDKGDISLLDIDDKVDGHVLDKVYEHVYGSILKS